MSVPDGHLAGLEVEGRAVDVLIGVFHLVGARMRIAERVEPSVAVEVVVVGLVPEVAAVSKPLALFVRLPDRLVHEVPDEAALEGRILLREVPVLLDAAVGVAHRVRVLAEHERLLRRVLHIVLAAGRRRVHRTHDVGVVAVHRALVLNRTRRVDRLHRRALGREVLAVARLVAKRPDENRRMVAVGLDHPRTTFDMALQVVLPVRKRLFPVAVAMRLDVRLADDHDALAVAKVVPRRIVRIMTGAHGIHVERLEDLNVLLHASLRDGVTALRLHLVAIRALEQHPLAVQVEDRVLDFDLAEAEGDGAVVGAAEDPPAPFVLDRRHVDVRIVRRPELHLGKVPFLDDVALLVADDELAALHVVRKLRLDHKIERRVLMLGEEIDIAEDARKAPEVLVLEVRAVAVLVDLDLERVRAKPLEMRRQVELRRQAAVLGIADVLAVQTDLERG